MARMMGAQKGGPVGRALGRSGVSVGVTSYKWNEISCKCWNIWLAGSLSPGTPPKIMRHRGRKLPQLGGKTFAVSRATPTWNLEEIRIGDALSLSGTCVRKCRRACQALDVRNKLRLLLENHSLKLNWMSDLEIVISFLKWKLIKVQCHFN